MSHSWSVILWLFYSSYFLVTIQIRQSVYCQWTHDVIACKNPVFVPFEMRSIPLFLLQRYLQKMEYLDMHDNYLEDIDNLESLSYLTHLDVSINKIQYLSDLHLKLGNVIPCR